MTIDLRFKAAGILFFLVLLLNLVMSPAGSATADEILHKRLEIRVLEVIVSVIGLGALLFTSEAIG